MDKQHQELIHFSQTAKGLDEAAKLKLILVAAGAKPATFFALKITPKNIDEKEHLEKHLKACNLKFIVGRPRAYEEIAKIKGNAIKWDIKGTWYGYDIFPDIHHMLLFAKYVKAVQQQKHEEADKTAGDLYGYPSCCVEHYINEHDIKFLCKKYTHYSYYKHIHELERKYPLLLHTPCSTKCNTSKKLNATYAKTLKKFAPKFWKSFSAIKKYASYVVVDVESELLQNNYGVQNNAPVFSAKDGHDYTVVTMKPVDNHYYMIAYLTKQSIERGAVFGAKIKKRYNYADVKLGKPKKVINDLHHERRMVIP